MREKSIIISFIFSLALFITEANAQQDPMYTQYMVNMLSVNPGYAGSRGVLNVTGLVRSQWLGIKGAPETQTFFIHSPFPLSMGLGLSLVNDKIGPINQTMIFGNYSYTIQVSQNSKLAFGLSAGINLMQSDLTSLEISSSGNRDDAFSRDINRLTPNFGFGMYYHSDRWYIGASTPKLLETGIGNDNQYIKKVEKRHYFLIGGYVLEINKYLKFKPTFLTKMTTGAPLSVDLTASFLLKEKLWLGIAHRWGDSFGAIIQFQLNDQLKAGYAYDYTMSKLMKYNSGSHEIILSYDFYYKKNIYIIRSPRYF